MAAVGEQSGGGRGGNAIIDPNTDEFSRSGGGFGDADEFSGGHGEHCEGTQGGGALECVGGSGSEPTT